MIFTLGKTDHSIKIQRKICTLQAYEFTIKTEWLITASLLEAHSIFAKVSLEAPSFVINVIAAFLD